MASEDSKTVKADATRLLMPRTSNFVTFYWTKQVIRTVQIYCGKGLHKRVNTSSNGVAQLVGVLSHTVKVCRFDSQSGSL